MQSLDVTDFGCSIRSKINGKDDLMMILHKLMVQEIYIAQIE
jgi:hypothetical protein